MIAGQPPADAGDAAADAHFKALATLRDMALGVRSDIFYVERATEVYRVIGQRAPQINVAGYGDLFGAVQNAALAEVILGISKIFERPNTRFPGRSLPTIIEYLATHANTLRPLHVESILGDLRRVAPGGVARERIEDPAFTRAVAAKLEDVCPRPARDTGSDLSDALESLRTLRDKSVAHHEAISPTEFRLTTWEHLNRLMTFARHALNVIAFGYADVIITDSDGVSVTAYDAEVASLQLVKLLDTAGVADVPSYGA